VRLKESLKFKYFIIFKKQARQDKIRMKKMILIRKKFSQLSLNENANLIFRRQKQDN